VINRKFWNSLPIARKINQTT